MSVLAVLLTGSFLSVFLPDNTVMGERIAARRVEKIVQKRMNLLDIYAAQLLKAPSGVWPESLPDPPADVVIYRYVDDTIQSWVNQFSVRNDDIRTRELSGRLMNPGRASSSPLSHVRDSADFVNMGPRWYLVKSIAEGRVRIIYGLSLVNSLDTRSYNGVNPVLHLGDRYSIRPLAESDGSVVTIDGRPSFKVISERLTGADKSGTVLFNPVLYADPPLFPSLGALLLLNLLLTLICITAAIERKKRGRKWPGYVVAPVVLAFAHLGFRSIMLNSNITFELFKYGEISWYSIVVYLSYLVLLVWIPLLLGFDPRRRKVRMWTSALIALYFVAMSSTFGFRREQARLEVIANRLAVNRDLPAELMMRRVETGVQNDILIASLLKAGSSSATIRGRLSEVYFQRLLQRYNIEVFSSSDRMIPALEQGEQVAPDSHFLFIDRNGEPSYAGMFLYSFTDGTAASMMVVISLRKDKAVKGYSSILGVTPPGKVEMPSGYSYARYRDGVMISCKGSFAYPVSRPENLEDRGYRHFVNDVADGETVVISRQKNEWLYYIIETVFLFLVVFLMTSLFNLKERRRISLRTSYRGRIMSLVMISLVVTLVAMALVSMLFVISRTRSNQTGDMSEKVDFVRKALDIEARQARSASELQTPDMLRLLNETGKNLESDISIFDLTGRLLMTTCPTLYDNMLLYGRINGNAFRKIRYEGYRYFVNRERIGSVSLYNMYTPLTGADGDIIAIACSPYTADSFDLEKDAVNHSMTMLTLFLTLLLLARMMTHTVLDRMFNPLYEMRQKMSATGVDALEYIKYDYDDEISTLVKSYNRMVSDLTESTRRLAQAERDKAWSGMARQVAHEIKNPLTPMKLQLQRIIRLKQKNDPAWQEKFDEMSAIILDHIDILTETANEFSSFAKLYSEDPVEINLDEVLLSEIAMFDSRPDIEFSYFGLEGAVVSGPKPQLTRVFVNLINNAVQALEDGGHIDVSLRNSVRDGYYDIVVEDDGPGVLPENIDKLFAPNFTTKNGGSGLGLAISRSILERCGGSIEYSKSFRLGGACFTVRYPKRPISA